MNDSLVDPKVVDTLRTTAALVLERPGELLFGDGEAFLVVTRRDGSLVVENENRGRRHPAFLVTDDRRVIDLEILDTFASSRRAALGLRRVRCLQPDRMPPGFVLEAREPTVVHPDPGATLRWSDDLGEHSAWRRLPRALYRIAWELHAGVPMVIASIENPAGLPLYRLADAHD